MPDIRHLSGISAVILSFFKKPKNGLFRTFNPLSALLTKLKKTPKLQFQLTKIWNLTR